MPPPCPMLPTPEADLRACRPLHHDDPRRTRPSALAAAPICAFIFSLLSVSSSSSKLVIKAAAQPSTQFKLKTKASNMLALDCFAVKDLVWLSSRVHYVVMGNAPEIGDALLQSTQLLGYMQDTLITFSTRITAYVAHENR
ncbi:hypothetical protein U9M48_042514 [Paspalum notatum var. saurae]|uniref:Uncharacterized protein n=1 Tax=Paspalum notatum var. saurae TaxID=547442 RepID=A0AAQ3UV86_PASNO